jgi:uncharacterized repeat protein (TIGR01451 family)
MCGSVPRSIRVTNVTMFSPFVLSGLPLPEITVLPAGLDFGSQDVDAGATVSQTVTITNDGTVDLHITSVGLTGGDADQFSIESDTGEGTLTPGSARTIRVAFDPTTTGTKSANLSIQSDDGDEPVVDVSLGGSGTAAGLQVDKQVDTGGLSEVPLGDVVTYTIVIRNDGSGVAFNAVLTDPLPTAIESITWVQQGSAFLPTPRLVQWGPHDVAAQTAYTLSFSANVVTDTQFAGQTVDNVAYVVADNAGPDDDSAGFDIASDDFYIYLSSVLK